LKLFADILIKVVHILQFRSKDSKKELVKSGFSELQIRSYVLRQKRHCRLMLCKWVVETCGGDDFLLVCVRVKECLKTQGCTGCITFTWEWNRLLSIILETQKTVIHVTREYQELNCQVALTRPFDWHTKS